MSNDLFNILLIGAAVYFLTRKKTGPSDVVLPGQTGVMPTDFGIGFYNKSAEPNFPTTAVAGIGRGWTVYSKPAGQAYLRTFSLTT